MLGSETNCILVGLEITLHRRTAIVALHHAQLGVNTLSLKKITEMLEVPKSTCTHIYKHAFTNAAAKWLVVQLEREGRDTTECDAFLAGIDAQLNSLYAVPEVQTVLGESSADEEEEYIPLGE
jgi:predicted XRE-type DNA-binding protein